MTSFDNREEIHLYMDSNQKLYRVNKGLLNGGGMKEQRMSDSSGEFTNESLFENEESLCECIVAGDYEHLKTHYIDYRNDARIIMKRKDTRSNKNMIIMLLGRIFGAALQGGVSKQEIFIAKQYYSQQAEKANTISELEAVLARTLSDMCALVRRTNENHSEKRELEECAKYILDNPDKTLSLHELSIRFGYNSSYLSRKFKQVYGMNLRNYILKAKLSGAALFLRNTEQPISEIAAHFNFSSQSHMQNAFKSEYGVTPLEYRKNISKEN